MKHIEEYRDADTVRVVIDEIQRLVTRPWVLMEICGGQTHAIMRFGLDQLLPPEIELLHGPGCPVCVTPLEQIERALAIASRPEVIFTSYGDMLRVPGADRDLFWCAPLAGMCAWSIRPWMRSRLPSKTRINRWSSSPSASRPPPRLTR